jgi:hypothetical protein
VADFASDTQRYVANLQRAVTFNPSLSTAYTIQLVCMVASSVASLGWNTSGSSIIACRASTMVENEVNA